MNASTIYLSINKFKLIMIILLGISLLDSCGSRPSDISSTQTVQNPLPPCTKSPNCVRITKQIDLPIEKVFAASKTTLKNMGAEKLSSTENYKLESVFKVFFFRDDLVLQCTKRDSVSTYLHIRSASRVGYSDLGVNTRRVKRFLRKLQQGIPNSYDK